MKDSAVAACHSIGWAGVTADFVCFVASVFALEASEGSTKVASRGAVAIVGPAFGWPVAAPSRS